MPKVAETPAIYLADEAWPAESVLTGRFDLPPEYAWFNELDASARQDFFAGLLKVLVRPPLTLPDGRRRSLLDALDEYLRGWQATVELESALEVRQSFDRARDDLEHGRVVSYQEVFGNV